MSARQRKKTKRAEGLKRQSNSERKAAADAHNAAMEAEKTRQPTRWRTTHPELMALVAMLAGGRIE